MCPRCPTCLIWVKKVQFYPNRAKVHGHQEISVSRGWTKNLGRSRMRLERNEIQSHPKLKNLNCIGKLDFDIRHERKVENGRARLPARKTCFPSCLPGSDGGAGPPWHHPQHDFDIRHERKVQNLFLGWTPWTPVHFA